MICAVILAGDKGTRFWPLSGENCPKQMLNIVGEKTLLLQTIKGLNRFNNPFHLKPLENDVNRIRFIIEPTCKHTVPVVVLAVITPNKLSSDFVSVVVPSDHIIKGQRHFRIKFNGP
jgi:mannose-1-phosphate guanylyltransferase